MTIQPLLKISNEAGIADRASLAVLTLRWPPLWFHQQARKLQTADNRNYGSAFNRVD